MTNKERVVCAIEGKPVDHVPVSFSLHFPREVAFGDKAVDAHIEFYEKTGVDIMKIMNEHLLPQFGTYEGIHSWKEFPHHHVSDKFIQDQLDLIKKIQDKTPDGTFYLGTLHGVLASMIHPFEPQIGYEKVRDEHTRCFREDKDAYLTAAKITTETMIMLIEEMGKIGVDGVYYASLGAEKRYFTDAEFAEAIAPFDMEMLKAIKDNNMYSFLHTCKDGLNMKRYADYAKYSDVINWGIYEGNDFSLEDGKTPSEEEKIEMQEEEAICFDMYMDDMTNVRKLTEEEIMECIKRDDAISRNMLIEHYLTRVVDWVKPYTKKGLAYGDLIQEGNIGLIQAITDINRELNDIDMIDAYIKKHTIRHIKNVIDESESDKLVGDKVVNRINAVNDCANMLKEDLGRKPTREEVAKLMNIEMDELDDIIKLSGDKLDSIEKNK